MMVLIDIYIYIYIMLFTYVCTIFKYIHFSFLPNHLASKKTNADQGERRFCGENFQPRLSAKQDGHVQ